jgi:hypothetical protein
MIIDFFDDLGDAYFSSLNGGSPPEMLKTASWAEPFELLDRDFALILVDQEGTEHRKFACHDAGNVEMSLWYLQNVDHGLPDYAIKMAMKNLDGLVEGGTKVASAPFTEEDLRHVVDERRVKIAMPTSPTMSASLPSGSMSPGMMGSATGKSLNSATSPTKSTLMPPSVPKGGAKLAPPPGAKMASGASPFDMLHSVQRSWDDMDPYDRRENALHLQELSKTAGVQVPWSILKYAGAGLNPNFEALMQHRKSFSVDEKTQDNYDRLGKMASHLDIEEVLSTLHLIDETCSLPPRYGQNVTDPVLCVYGQEKEAEFSWVHGGDLVNETQLRNLASSPEDMKQFDDLFTIDLMYKFKEDPLATFKSMPDEQKVLVARMATQGGYHNDGGFFR